LPKFVFDAISECASAIRANGTTRSITGRSWRDAKKGMMRC